MQELFHNLNIRVNEKTFVKDPQSSVLGIKIVQHSIILIHKLGFESFTFRKLGLQIGSNESSIYRYFENKHKLLLYLTAWYWGWMEYHLVLNTYSMSEPVARLEKAIEVITGPVNRDDSFSHVDEVLLHKIIISEYSKSYLTKEVDQENKEGYFEIYKQLVFRIRDMIKAANPDYPHAASLSSTILEGSLHQYFLKDHFKSLTNCTDDVTPTDFFKHLVFKTIESNG